MRMLLKPLVLGFTKTALRKHRIIWQDRSLALNFHRWRPRMLRMAKPSTPCMVLPTRATHMLLIPITLGISPTMATLTIRERLPHQLTTLP